MPAVDDPFSIAASLPGQLAALKGQVKDLSVNNTQALTQALAAATAAAGSAATASAAATAAATAASNAQVSPAVAGNSTSGFSLGTSFGDVTSCTFTVPSGYTRALISASGSVSAAANTGGPGILESRIVIAGAAGAFGATQTSAASQVPPVPAFGAASLTGLTAGGTITVTIQAYASGPTSTFLTAASVSGTALFLR